MPDVKKKSSARYFKSLALGALFPFKLPWVETQTVGQAARPTGSGSIAKAMHGPCAIFVRRVAALSEPYATLIARWVAPTVATAFAVPILLSMHACSDAAMHACVHTLLLLLLSLLVVLSAYIHAYIHTYVNTYIHKFMHA